MRRTVLLTASMAAAVLVACGAALLAALPVVGQTSTATMVGAGDIAGCAEERHSGATADLLGKIGGTVYTLGDNVQGQGDINEFKNCYDPTWGKYKKRTRPAVGNHEYYNATADARPYFDYFGARAGSPRRGYYSYDLKSWHVVVLNSNCGRVDGCESSSPQGRWLRNDLQENRSRCTLAYFHHPLQATGTNTPSPQVRPFWSMLHEQGADVILSGHAHRYERHAPMTPAGKRSADGIRQFVVGTGGADGGTEIHKDQTPNLQKVDVGTPGVLRLSLRDGSYAWKFVPIPNRSFTDSGTDRCH